MSNKRTTYQESRTYFSLCQVPYRIVVKVNDDQIFVEVWLVNQEVLVVRVPLEPDNAWILSAMLDAAAGKVTGLDADRASAEEVDSMLLKEYTYERDDIP